MKLRRPGFLVLILLIFPGLAATQNQQKKSPNERDLAARFAPDFHQALGERPRFDHLTNFDFDGNWRGDDNWVNAENTKFALRAYIYYSVIETKTHYFIHYAVFHPRDYKGGDKRGALLSELLRQGAELGAKYDPSGKLNELALAHENDLEGCLVVVAKAADPGRERVVFVETVSHNRYLRYRAPGEKASGNFSEIELNGTHPLLYIEPKGHGIEALTNANRNRGGGRFLLYRAGDRAEEPPESTGGEVEYALVSMMDDLWPRARGGVNETYVEARDYRAIQVQALAVDGEPVWREMKTPSVGSAFLGNVGMPNAARPPWGWFDGDIGTSSAGLWFFDPATTIRDHFGLGENFSTVYTKNDFIDSAVLATPVKPVSK